MLTHEIETYFQNVCIPLRLACATASGWPFVLSLWYLYRDGALYCATKETAKVVEYLSAEPRCAFEVAADEPPYCGVRGQAMATILPDEGDAVLEALLERYLGSAETSLGLALRNRPTKEVAIRLEPVNLFTWNYTSRMANSLDQVPAKPCP